MLYFLMFRFRANPTEVELLLVGRIFVLVLVAISVVWIPIIQVSCQFPQLQTITLLLTGKPRFTVVQLHPVHHIVPGSAHLRCLPPGNILAQVVSESGA